MKKIICLLLVCLLCGCQKENDNEIKKIYEDAFEQTFVSNYASLTTTIQENEKMITYTEYFINQDKPESLSVAIDYQDEQLANGRVTCVYEGNYLLYASDYLEQPLEFSGGFAGEVSPKFNLCASNAPEIDYDKSEKTADGLVIYYQLSDLYLKDIVKIENGKMISETFVGYTDDSYQEENYWNENIYMTASEDKDQAIQHARSYRGQYVKDLEEFIQQIKG